MGSFIETSNILLAITDDEIIPKIADFGLAKALENPSLGQPLTQEGAAMGTPLTWLLSKSDASMVDARADIFSLGAILYEIVTGQVCFGHGASWRSGTGSATENSLRSQTYEQTFRLG